MKILNTPHIRVIASSVLSTTGVDSFLDAEAGSWRTDATSDQEKLSELAGRICYMSFGDKQGRKTNREYLDNILESAHGSVLEHASFSLLISGISRSLTHELIRHRAGFAYSQLSQRYVDESDTDYVIPDVIDSDPELRAQFLTAIEQAHQAYLMLAEGLAKKAERDFPELSKTERRKLARQAARSVLPNATETKIVVTANVRAWRHFIELRGSSHAEPEIRKLAVLVLQTLQPLAPNLFADYDLEPCPDGGKAITVSHRKV
ncbi:MAG: FAD-dependent thymidylate synthase [bacterium]|nr:FAD-dependent thymidylate synthase [bacterium]